MGLHSNRTVSSSGLGTSEVKQRLNLGIDHTHDRLYVLDPALNGGPTTRTVDFGRGWTLAFLVRVRVTLVGGKWTCIMPLVGGIQTNFKSFYRFSSLVYAGNELCDFIHLPKKGKKLNKTIRNRLGCVHTI